MGRYPFLAMIPRYLKDHSSVLSEGTRKLREQRLVRIGKRMDELKRTGTISTTNPKNLTRDDALEIVSDMASNTWKPQYLRVMVENLKHYVSYCGNPIFDQLSRLRLLPKAPEPSIKTISSRQEEAINKCAEKIGGWTGEVARLICALYPATGLRASELRMARIEDLDTSTWEIRVVNPKGKDRYASQRVAPVLPQARKAVMRYLDARKKRLIEAGYEDAEPLLLCMKNGAPSYYSASGLTNIRKDMERLSGVRFSLKDFRSTFAQRTIDLDPTLLSPVSKALGHKSSMTTERYYARIRDAPALRQIQKAYEKAEPVGEIPQNPLIDHHFPPTGYA